MSDGNKIYVSRRCLDSFFSKSCFSRYSIISCSTFDFLFRSSFVATANWIVAAFCLAKYFIEYMIVLSQCRFLSFEKLVVADQPILHNQCLHGWNLYCCKFEILSQLVRVKSARKSGTTKRYIFKLSIQILLSSIYKRSCNRVANTSAITNI